MNILLFNPDIEQLRIISFALESRLGLQVKQAHQVESAFALLLEDDAVDLLIISQTSSTPLFVKYLASLGSKIPVILVKRGNEQHDPKFSGINILAQLSAESLLQDLPALIGANFRVANSGPPSELDYCRISVELLLRTGSLKGDVFVKLSNLKFVKLFNADTKFTEEDLARVWGVKRIDFLYIKKEATTPFIQKLQGELNSMMLKTSEGDESLLSLVSQVQETIQSLAQKTGITEQVIKLTNIHVDFALKVIGRTPQLKKAMASIMKNKEGYLANHSVQVAHIACCIAAKLNWPSNTTFQKLIFAAFVHDLTLANPEHAKIATKSDLQKLRGLIPQEEFEAVETHMVKAAEVVGRFSQIPTDVSQIILQHHERPDGSGFPRGLAPNAIAPLAAVFIAAHEIADETQKKGAFDLDAFWAQRIALYSSGTFRSILKAFQAANDDAA